MSAPANTSDRLVRVAAWPFDVRPGAVERNLESALRGLEQAAAAQATLLVLPEKWTTSHLPAYDADVRARSAEALAAVHANAAERGITVVGSAIGGADTKPFNEEHVLGAAGDLRPYRKRLLFSPMDEGRSCDPGTGLPETVSTPAGRVAAVICYDIRFPELTRHAFYQRADLLVVPAEWPRARSAILELLARARAVENQCWVVSCNRAGSITIDGAEVEFPGTALLVDPLGREVARTDDGGFLVGDVNHAVSREVRRSIPCARDLERAGLGPVASETGTTTASSR